MKQLMLNELQKVSGCGGGGVASPPAPDRNPLQTRASGTDGSYTPPPPPKTEEGN